MLPTLDIDFWLYFLVHGKDLQKLLPHYHFDNCIHQVSEDKHALKHAIFKKEIFTLNMLCSTEFCHHGSSG